MKQVMMTKMTEGIYKLSTKDDDMIDFIMRTATDEFGLFNPDKYIKERFENRFGGYELVIETALIQEVFGIKMPYLNQNFN